MAMTISNNTMMPSAAVMPLVGSACGTGTILLVYMLTSKAGHLPNGVSTPPISLLGCNSPEHLAYQIGFTVTGLLLLACIQNWKTTFYPKFSEKHPIASIVVLLGSYLAVVGVVGQGLITLEENFLANRKEGLMVTHQSVTHQLLALVFFGGAAVHCYTTLFLCFFGSPSIKTMYSRSSIRFKLVCSLTSLISWPIAEALRPTNTASLTKRMFAVGGFVAWFLKNGR